MYSYYDYPTVLILKDHFIYRKKNMLNNLKHFIQHIEKLKTWKRKATKLGVYENKKTKTKDS